MSILSNLTSKPVFWPILIGAIIIALILAGCNGNVEEDGKQSIQDSLLDLGYENCMICHAGGKIPITEHCMEALGVPVTLENCLECHLDMRGIVIAREDAYRGCAGCHKS